MKLFLFMCSFIETVELSYVYISYVEVVELSYVYILFVEGFKVSGDRFLLTLEIKNSYLRSEIIIIKLIITK